MGYGKTVNVMMLDDVPDGRLRVESPSGAIIGFCLPRSTIKKFDMHELHNAGVYMLYGNNLEGQPAVYVGEAEDVYDRLCNHLVGTKSYEPIWEVCMAFAVVPTRLDKAKIKYMEHELYNDVKKIHRFQLFNSNTPHRSVLSPADVPNVKAFLDEVRVYSAILGFYAIGKSGIGMLGELSKFKPKSNMPKQRTLDPPNRTNPNNGGNGGPINGDVMLHPGEPLPKGFRITGYVYCGKRHTFEKDWEAPVGLIKDLYMAYPEKIKAMAESESNYLLTEKSKVGLAKKNKRKPVVDDILYNIDHIDKLKVNSLWRVINACMGAGADISIIIKRKKE